MPDIRKIENIGKTLDLEKIRFKPKKLKK